MASNLGSALSGLKKPGIGAKPARKGTGTIGAIDPLPAKPKTFTDKNLEQGFGVGGANNVTTRGAKPGGSIAPELNATPQISTAIKGLSKT